jgi:hypothetical protein
MAHKSIPRDLAVLSALPRTQAEARALGARWFFTGKPCRRGHLAARSLQGSCTECHLVEVKTKYVANPEPFVARAIADAKRRKEADPDGFRAAAAAKLRAARAAKPDQYRAMAQAWQNAHRDERNEQARARDAANPEKVREKGRRYRAAHPDASYAQFLRWCAENPTKVRARDRRKRMLRLQRYVTWADFDEIEKIYEEARRLTQETGIEHHVDHKIPLRGRTVSGLHVHQNLQILTAVDNQHKHNKYEAD